LGHRLYEVSWQPLELLLRSCVGVREKYLAFRG